MQFASRLYLRAREGLLGAHRGQTYVEYAYVVLFVALAVIAGYNTLGSAFHDAVIGFASSVASA